MRISLDGYGFNIRKVSRCRPTVSNEIILATKQEFFFTKVAPAQSITYIALLSFWLILLPWMFILPYTTINVYISVNAIFQCSYLLFGWVIGHPLSTYATGEMEGDHPKCVQCILREGVEKPVIKYVRTKWMVPNKCCGIFFVHWFGQVR